VADAPLEKVPLYVRAGSSLPLGPERNHVDQPIDVLELALHLDEHGRAHGTLYEDDGHTLAHEKGAFRRTTIDVAPGPRGSHVSLRTEGSWRPATPRRWRFVLDKVHVELLDDGAVKELVLPGR
jgi:alpha-glucosidase (family GH31 glycosyl hydrolase)